MWTIEVISEVIREYYLLLTNDFQGLYRKLDGHLIAMIGVIFVDPFVREDSRCAKEEMVEALKAGANVMWFPEGEWNPSPHVLVLPLFWGIAEVAWQTGALVQPSASRYLTRNTASALARPMTCGA